MDNSVTLWQKVLAFLDDNKEKHFTDNIYQLNLKYNITYKFCNCENQQINTIDVNGCCKDCKLKRAI